MPYIIKVLYSYLTVEDGSVLTFYKKFLLRYREKNSFMTSIIFDEILSDFYENLSSDEKYTRDYIYSFLLFIQRFSSVYLHLAEGSGRGVISYSRELPYDLDSSSVFIIFLSKLGFCPSFVKNFWKTALEFYEEKEKLFKTWVGEFFPWGKDNHIDPIVNMNILRAFITSFFYYRDVLSDFPKIYEINTQICFKLFYDFDLVKLEKQSYWYKKNFIFFFSLKLAGEIIEFLQNYSERGNYDKLGFLEDGGRKNNLANSTLYDCFYLAVLKICSYDLEGKGMFSDLLRLLSSEICGFSRFDYYYLQENIKEKFEHFIKAPFDFWEDLYVDYPFMLFQKRYFSPPLILAIFIRVL